MQRSRSCACIYILIAVCYTYLNIDESELYEQNICAISWLRQLLLLPGQASPKCCFNSLVNTYVIDDTSNTNRMTSSIQAHSLRE